MKKNFGFVASLSAKLRGRKETVEEYLKRGGVITKLPPATISREDIITVREHNQLFNPNGHLTILNIRIV